MHINLVRHSEADLATHDLGDRGRTLTLHGRDQARAAGDALHGRHVLPTRAWSSPFVRAVQTAELLLARLPFPGPLECRADLFPESDPRHLIAALHHLPAGADLLVTGHEPYMSALASALLGIHIGGFETGAILRIHLPPDARPTLVWRWMSGRFIG